MPLYMMFLLMTSRRSACGNRRENLTHHIEVDHTSCNFILKQTIARYKLASSLAFVQCLEGVSLRFGEMGVIRKARWQPWQ